MWRHDATQREGEANEEIRALGLDGIWFANRNEWSWRGWIFWPNATARIGEITDEEWAYLAYNYHP